MMLPRKKQEINKLACRYLQVVFCSVIGVVALVLKLNKFTENVLFVLVFRAVIVNGE
jgi:hypothetical protein